VLRRQGSIAPWDAKAYDDLDSIIDYIAELSPAGAEKTISQIQKVASLLSSFPNLGEKVDESGLYSLVVSNTPYIIFYRVFPDYVNIRGVFHGSQRRVLE
jgi:plasmid stabilization system protein ParE